MSLTKEPAGSELALNFDETLFPLPEGQRTIAPNVRQVVELDTVSPPDAKCELSFQHRPEQDFAPSPTVPGIFAAQAQFEQHAAVLPNGTETSGSFVPPAPVKSTGSFPQPAFAQQQTLPPQPSTISGTGSDASVVRNTGTHSIPVHTSENVPPQSNANSIVPQPRLVSYQPQPAQVHSVPQSHQSQPVPMQSQQALPPAPGQSMQTQPLPLQPQIPSAPRQTHSQPQVQTQHPPQQPIHQQAMQPQPSMQQPVTPEQVKASQSQATAQPQQPAAAQLSSAVAQSDRSGSTELQLLKELQRVNGATDLEDPGASKDEIATILEGFARVLRSGNADVFADISYKDRSPEIMQLKELLLEAQETIISLLNDRVFDRAKIAKLESEARLLPDLQAQATRAMGLAMRSEEVQRELSQVRVEVERLRTSYVRQEQDKAGFMSWLFGKRST